MPREGDMEKDVWKELKGFRYSYRISEEAKLERQLPDGTWTRLNPYFSAGGGRSSALYASIAVLPMGHKRFSVDTADGAGRVDSEEKTGADILAQEPMHAGLFREKLGTYQCIGKKPEAERTKQKGGSENRPRRERTGGLPIYCRGSPG